jgi:hypothetical protein
VVSGGMDSIIYLFSSSSLSPPGSSTSRCLRRSGGFVLSKVHSALETHVA